MESFSILSSNNKCDQAKQIDFIYLCIVINKYGNQNDSKFRYDRKTI